MSPESSSIPGRWKTATIEAARGPMLEVTNPKCHTITVMASTQLMKTELINNIIGYHIHQDPCPILVIQPSDSMAETWATDRLDKMIRDTPVLTELVAKKLSKGKDGENLKHKKTFPGGSVTVIGARSPTELASRPIRIVLADEIDKYPLSAGKEGDPIKLAEERTATFFNRKCVRVCSPTVEGESRIAEEYLKGDQREFHGQCPYCLKYEKLRFKQIKYNPKDIKDDNVFYECSHCKVHWNESDRLKAISKGKYIAKKPFKGHASFHANKIASPWDTLAVLVNKYESSKNNPELLKTFYNTQLAETWKVKSDAPDYMRLYERRESYPQNKPNEKVMFLTAGVDVQGDRFEVEIVGWGKDKQSWSIDYRVIPCNTSDKTNWSLLDKILLETWNTTDGRQLQIKMMAVDTGYNTQYVYNWIRTKDPNRVRAVKGYDHIQMIFGKPSAVELNFEGKTVKNALQLWPIGVSLIKSEIYSLLKMEGPRKGEDKPGFCHFPQYDENYFKGLCSEHLIETRRKGRTVRVWEQFFTRNEPLDVRVYNRAAASMYGMDRFTEEDWQVLEGTYMIDNVTKSYSIDDEEPEYNDFWDRNSNRRGNY